MDRLPQKLCVPIDNYAVTQAVTADGTMMSFTGCVQVPKTIKIKAMKTRLLISPAIYHPVILGCDSSEENNVILNYGDKTVTIPQIGTMHLGSGVRLNKTRRVFMAEDVTIPARSQVVIMAEVKHSGDMDKTEEGIVEPDRIFVNKPQPLGCNVLATARCATLPVLLINPLHEDQQFRRNTTVGHFNPTPPDSGHLYLPMSVDEQNDLPTSPRAA